MRWAAMQFGTDIQGPQRIFSFSTTSSSEFSLTQLNIYLMVDY